MNKSTKYEEIECPLCGEYLVLNKNGVMKNEKTGEIIYTFTCEECNQAFALEKDREIKLIPYDSNMKPIENKCKICGKIENYNEKGLFLLNIETAFYEFHCFNCGIPVLQNWLDKSSKNKNKVTKKNIYEIYEIYDLYANNKMLQNIEENSEKYKSIIDELKNKIGLK